MPEEIEDQFDHDDDSDEVLREQEIREQEYENYTYRSVTGDWS